MMKTKNNTQSTALNTVYEFDQRHLALYTIPDFVAIGCVKSEKKVEFL